MSGGYKSVEEYLQDKRQQAAEREKKERNQLMYQENLMERIYATSATADSYEYPFEDASGRRYKLRFLPITDAQYEEVKKYASAQTANEIENSSLSGGLFFSDTGGKIKKLAVIARVIGIVLSLILGLRLIINGADESSALTIFGGIMCIIGGSLISWIGTFLLYAFGQLVENSDKLVALKQQENDK